MALIELSDDIYEKLVKLAKSQGKTLADYVTGLVEWEADEPARELSSARELVTQAFDDWADDEPRNDWLDIGHIIIGIGGNWDDHHGDVRDAMCLAIEQGWVERKPQDEAWRLTPLGLKELFDIEVAIEEIPLPSAALSIPIFEAMDKLDP